MISRQSVSTPSTRQSWAEKRGTISSLSGSRLQRVSALRYVMQPANPICTCQFWWPQREVCFLHKFTRQYADVRPSPLAPHPKPSLPLQEVAQLHIGLAPTTPVSGRIARNNPDFNRLCIRGIAVGNLLETRPGAAGVVLSPLSRRNDFSSLLVGLVVAIPAASLQAQPLLVLW